MPPTPAGRYHRIERLVFRGGGFLSAATFEFDPNLNCVIGGRGTGKTTVVEALRYALDRMPDPARARERHRLTDKLLESNLASGTVRVEVVTRDGARYAIERSHGDPPVVTDGQGKPVQFAIGRDVVFGVDVYSQNEIEGIAVDPFAQLQLLDKSISQQLAPIQDGIRESSRRLQENAADLARDGQAVSDLKEELEELPDVLERLRQLAPRGTDERTERLRGEHESKTQREHEVRLLEGLERFHTLSPRLLQVALEQVKRELELALKLCPSSSPNADVLAAARSEAEEVLRAVEPALRTGMAAAEAGRRRLAQHKDALAGRQAAQEKLYRDTLETLEEDKARTRERVRLEERKAALLGRQALLEQHTQRLASATAEREALRQRLSELRDQRHALRSRVAADLTARLTPMIRIRVEPFGNVEDYAALLRAAFKGSGIRYATLVDRIIERLPPAELAALVRADDVRALERQLDLDPERAARLIALLKEPELLGPLETVELHDRPIFELKDGTEYKPSSALSTGQKCTAILPVLLLESERPLVVDQPEDNLDNAFVYDTIVRSIHAVRDRRQLIFVTHNPNIPVLGNADRVFVLQSTGRAATVQTGTVDQVRPDVERILEGGSEAFRLRMARYGY